MFGVILAAFPRVWRLLAIGLSGLFVVTACASSRMSNSLRYPSPSGASMAATTSKVAGGSVGPVPAPTPGTINQTVAAEAVATRAPVALTAPASFGKAITARVVRSARINATGRIPGEMSGPAVSLTLEVSNGSSSSVSLASATVNVEDARGTPFVPLMTSTSALKGKLGPGTYATGVYVFHLPTGATNPLTISLSYSATAPVVLFVGTVA